MTEVFARHISEQCSDSFKASFIFLMALLEFILPQAVNIQRLFFCTATRFKIFCELVATNAEVQVP